MKTSDLLVALAALFCVQARADVAPPDDAAFAALHAMMRPRPGESRWMEVDWYPSVWEGRRKAAAEGKPLFLMAGSGGAPCAGC